MSEKVTKHKLTDVEKYIRAMHKAKANIAVVDDVIAVQKVTKHKLTDVEKYIRAMHKAKANIAVVNDVIAVQESFNKVFLDWQERN